MLNLLPEWQCWIILQTSCAVNTGCIELQIQQNSQVCRPRPEVLLCNTTRLTVWVTPSGNEMKRTQKRNGTYYGPLHAKCKNVSEAEFKSYM